MMVDPGRGGCASEHKNHKGSALKTIMKEAYRQGA